MDAQIAVSNPRIPAHLATFSPSGRLFDPTGRRALTYSEIRHSSLCASATLEQKAMTARSNPYPGSRAADLLAVAQEAAASGEGDSKRLFMEARHAAITAYRGSPSELKRALGRLEIAKAEALR